MHGPSKSVFQQNEVYTAAVKALAGIAHADFRPREGPYGNITCTFRVSERVSFGEAIGGLLEHAATRQPFTILRNVRAGELLIATDPEGNYTSISLYRNDDWNGSVTTPKDLQHREKPDESRRLLFDSRSFVVSPALLKAAAPWHFSEAIYRHMTGTSCQGCDNAVRLSEGKSLRSIYAFPGHGPRIFVYTTADRTCTTAALVTELAKKNRSRPIPGLLIEQCMSMERHRTVMKGSVSNERAYRIKELPGRERGE